MSSRYIMFPLPHPHNFQCKNFRDADGNGREVTAVLVPTFFSKRDAFTWTIGWSCNFSRTCQCGDCLYVHNKRREQ